MGREGFIKTLPRLILVGGANVGKSSLFNLLTGYHISVSNYPGTTVEVSTGVGNIGGISWEVMDTPGIFSIMPVTDDERVTRAVLLEGKARLVLHVVNACNLKRSLPLTIQLLELGLPLMLVVNMLDEALHLGLVIRLDKLERRLGIPVAGTVAAKGEGLEQLKTRIASLYKLEPLIGEVG